MEFFAIKHRICIGDSMMKCAQWSLPLVRSQLSDLASQTSAVCTASSWLGFPARGSISERSFELFSRVTRCHEQCLPYNFSGVAKAGLCLSFLTKPLKSTSFSKVDKSCSRTSTKCFYFPLTHQKVWFNFPAKRYHGMNSLKFLLHCY